MSRFVFPVVLLLSFPSFICEADATSFNETSGSYALSKTSKRQISQNIASNDIKINYGFSTLTLSNSSVKEIKIEHRPRQIAGHFFSLVRTAEATDESEFTFEYFERICNAINDASRLDDLKMVLSDANFQSLTAKRTRGTSQYLILAVLQSMRPQHIHILDYEIDQNHAILAVKGQSYFGFTYGLIHMVKSDGTWKIQTENWQAEGKKHMAPAVLRAETDNFKSKGLISDMTPDYRINKNFLPLTKADYPKVKRAFTFVFFMNKKVFTAEEVEDAYSSRKANTEKNKPRPHMHILWTGSRKIVTEQRYIQNQYPIDVSIANYDDGFASGEWNLILPRSKPREVIFSMLWSF